MTNFKKHNKQNSINKKITELLNNGFHYYCCVHEGNRIKQYIDAKLFFEQNDNHENN